jgi:gentisate 1,2-dioxygenase
VVDHEVHEQSDLFVLTDRPVFERLGLFREVSLDAPQEIYSVFKPR